MDAKNFLKKHKYTKKVFDNNEDYFKFLHKHPEIKVSIVNIEGSKTILYYEKIEKRMDTIKEKPKKTVKKPKKTVKKRNKSVTKIMNIIRK